MENAGVGVKIQLAKWWILNFCLLGCAAYWSPAALKTWPDLICTPPPPPTPITPPPPYNPQPPSRRLYAKNVEHLMLYHAEGLLNIKLKLDK